MKELSIEQKAKRYDEAIERANELNYVSDKDSLQHKTVEYIFPELKENYSSELKESERIRKVLVDYFKSYKEQEECGIKTFYGIPTDNIIAWLEKQGNINPTEDELKALRIAAYEPTKNWSEKLQSLYEKLTNCEQGEQKPVIEMKTPEESLGIDSDTYNKIVDECIYGEQKPANKAEPKFRIGDNIEPIDSCLGFPRTIYKICDGFYETNQGTLDFEFENNWRLIEQKPAWSEEDERIYMSIMYSFAHNYPLTIQQQEFVKSIKERVQLQPKQEWTEEDELIIKRIKSLLYSINENDFKDIYAWLEFLKNRVQPKQEWSKEDEGYYDAIIAKLEVTREDALLTDNEMDFLKSLEKRVFPKSTWNEEDEKVIHCLEYTIRHFYVDEDTIEWCCDWLKSLRPQSQWKPSDEQMKALSIAMCGVDDPLFSLYQELNKLREE